MCPLLFDHQWFRLENRAYIFYYIDKQSWKMFQRKMRLGTQEVRSCRSTMLPFIDFNGKKPRLLSNKLSINNFLTLIKEGRIYLQVKIELEWQRHSTIFQKESNQKLLLGKVLYLWENINYEIKMWEFFTSLCKKRKFLWKSSLASYE